MSGQRKCGRWITATSLLLVLATGVRAVAADPAAVAQFLNRHPAWRMGELPGSGQIEWFGGPPVAFASRGASLNEIEATARRWIQQEKELLGFNSRFLATVGLDEVDYLPAESARKRVFTFSQVVYGRRVLGARINFVLDERGNLIAVHNRGVPNLEQLPVSAVQTYAQAMNRAMQEFGWFERSSEGELVIYPVETAQGIEPKLSYLLELRREAGTGGTPDQRRYLIDATSGALLLSQSSVVSVGIEGRVQGYGLPGLLPYSGPQSTTLVTLPNVRVSGSVGTTATDALGRFRFTTFGPGPFAVRAQLGAGNGTVRNRAGTDASVEASVAAAVPALLTFNQERSEARTAEVAFHLGLEQLRDFIRAVTPNDHTMDAMVPCNVNVNSRCNAFFDGNSVNFFSSGGGCPNTAYSTIIAHELGHAAAARYIGLVSGAFGEGYADVWATYVYDDPIVGRNFFGPNTVLRDGRNATLYCADANESCHGGEVHREGEPLMGAFWKMRDRLNQSLGDAQGDAVADALFLAWSRSFGDARVSAAIEDHLLLLDDNDGNPLNGTPHFAAIDGAFRAQGFPGYQVERLRIMHEPVSEVQSTDLVAIVARVESSLSPVDQVRVYYSTGGAFNSVALTPTRNRDEWQGSIPGSIAPSVVSYYIWARDRDRFEARFPKGAPDDDRCLYVVGKLDQVTAYRFDGTSDEGWTHQPLTGEDDWQRGAPRGKAGDPTASFSGTMCFGNDLAADGAYRDGARSLLRSPIMALGSGKGTRLQFRRWLNVEPRDRARLLVNGRRVWENPTTREIKDGAWTLQDFDISGIVDAEHQVALQFEIESGTGESRGGWNIDDVRILTLGVNTQRTPCREPTLYGQGTMGAGGFLPEIAEYGFPRLGASIRVVANYLRGGSTALLMMGFAPLDARAAPGKPFLVNIDGPPRGQLLSSTVLGPPFPGFGSANVQIKLPSQPEMEGTSVHFQWIILDPAAPGGVASSRAMTLTLCSR